MTNALSPAAISAWSRETSLPARRRSFVSRRPISNRPLEMGTIRRPRASVTSRRASGTEGVYYRVGSWLRAQGSWWLRAHDGSWLTTHGSWRLRAHGSWWLTAHALSRLSLEPP